MIRFGTLGAARITPNALIKPVKTREDVVVEVIAARNRDRAERFATEHGIANVVDDYQAVVDFSSINAVYNPLVISEHRNWSIKALQAGKHVLCEKSFAMNAHEAREMADIAEQTGLVLMDAFHYRYHPVFNRAIAIAQSGEIGELTRIEGYFHIPVTDQTDIRMNYAVGGGVTMDIGCYPISWIRHLTGEEPDVLSAEAIEGPANVDLALSAEYRFPSGITAFTSGDMRTGVKVRMELIATGTRGTLTVLNPLVPQMGHLITVASAQGERTETLDLRPSYDYQMDAFVDAVTSGTPIYTPPLDAIGQMTTIDACYTAAGLPIRGA
ncbi:MAG: Gfo/Idh/MocA family oxidoreductase [Proteobacteria bacterium]|nr:Gfo/Idh/MocA family oxidoreductase [Pseudomonadota bacterium]